MAPPAPARNLRLGRGGSAGRGPQLRHTHRRRGPRCARATADETETRTAESLAIGSQAWRAFAKAAAGEWDGQAVRFDAATGEAMELDANIVPEAYREWGVELRDRQANCHTIVDDSNGLRLITRLVYPAVGCEADAVSFDNEDRCVLKGQGEDKTILPNGAFSAGCRVLPDDGSTFLLECAVPVDETTRYRFRHRLRLPVEAGRKPLVLLEVIAECRIGEDYVASGLAGPIPPSTCADAFPEWAQVDGTAAAHDAIASDASTLSSYVHLDPSGRLNDLGEPWLSRVPSALAPTAPAWRSSAVALSGPHGAFHAAVYSSDGTLTVAAGHARGRVVRWYDTAAGRLLGVRIDATAQ